MYIPRTAKKIFLTIIAFAPMVAVIKLNMMRLLPQYLENGLLLSSILISFLIFYSVHSGDMAEWFVHVVFPFKKNKKAPMLLLRQRNLIAAREYKLAEKELCELRLKNPRAPEIALMLAELHAGKFFCSPETALADLQYYIEKRSGTPHPLDCKIIMEYASLLQHLGNLQQAADLLQTESGKTLFYSINEQQNLKKRLDSIQLLLQNLNQQENQ